MARFNTDVENYELRLVRKRGKLVVADVTHWSRMKGGCQDGKDVKGKARAKLLEELKG